MSCSRCELLVSDGLDPCPLCALELEGSCLLRCGPEELGRFLRWMFSRKRGGLSLRRATCST